jgi:hypothetical protein
MRVRNRWTVFFVAEVEKMIVFSAGEAGKRGQSFLQEKQELKESVFLR